MFRMLALAGSMLAALPVAAEAQIRDHFRMATTNDLVALCSAPENDPMYANAIGFCHGFMVGAY